LYALIAALGCAGARAPSPASPAAPKSLYDRLGGKDAVRAVVADFVANLARDERVNYSFAMSDLDDLKQKLFDQVCELTGGPCHYAGREMRAVHARLTITNAQFDALVEDLVKSLDRFQVPAREKTELLTPLAGLRDDVVTVK
jgi:hemoglobin